MMSLMTPEYTEISLVPSGYSPSPLLLPLHLFSPLPTLPLFLYSLPPSLLSSPPSTLPPFPSILNVSIKDSSKVFCLITSPLDSYQ